MLRAARQTKDMGILVAAARSSSDGVGMEGSEAGCEPVVASFEGGELSWEGTGRGAERSASAEGFLVSVGQNVISCVTQSINGLCRCNHKYPRTTEADGSREVRRSLVWWEVPHGNRRSRRVY